MCLKECLKNTQVILLCPQSSPKVCTCGAQGPILFTRRASTPRQELCTMCKDEVGPEQNRERQNVSPASPLLGAHLGFSWIRHCLKLGFPGPLMSVYLPSDPSNPHSKGCRHAISDPHHGLKTQTATYFCEAVEFPSYSAALVLEKRTRTTSQRDS